MTEKTNMTEVQQQHQSTSPELSTTSTTKKTPPKLSSSDFKLYNRMAEHMDYFHNNFRETWNTLYIAASTGKRPSGMSIRSYINLGEQFCHHLTMHHTIEEQHIFPVLAKKMPAFRQELQLLTHHKLIHQGLEKFEMYLDQCKSGERELRMDEVREVMDGFGSVLWEHLDAEVKELGGENMSMFWSKEEMRRMPM